MWIWLQNNIGTVVVCAVLVLIFAAIAVKMIKDRKQGKPSCGCGCAGCAIQGKCHETNEKE